MRQNHPVNPGPYDHRPYHPNDHAAIRAPKSSGSGWITGLWVLLGAAMGVATTVLAGLYFLFSFILTSCQGSHGP